MENSKLLLDKHCAMCQIYGNYFVKTERLKSDELHFYQTVPESVVNRIDSERSKSEIAFIDGQSGKVIYGIDTLITLFAKNQKLLKGFLNLGPIYWVLKKVYRFVSFNRHIIWKRRVGDSIRDCTPPLHKGYRWAYILLTALITGLCLNHFSHLLFAQLGFEHSPLQEFIICFGQIIWQFMAVSILGKHRRLDYLGNMSTISLIGALLLLPVFLLNIFYQLEAWMLIVSFSLIVGTMFTLHVSRCKRMNLPFTLSISWVLYRTVVLLFVINLMLLQ